MSQWSDIGGGADQSRVTDIAPKTKGNLHKTPSLDFLVVHRGTVTLHLDSGEKRVVSEGEAIGKSPFHKTH